MNAGGTSPKDVAQFSSMSFSSLLSTLRQTSGGLGHCRYCSTSVCKGTEARFDLWGTERREGPGHE